MSAIAKDHSSTGHRAVAMVKLGMKRAYVTKQPSVSVRSIKIWLSRDRAGEPLRSRAGRARKTVLSRAKIVLAKAALKRHQSVSEEIGEETVCQMLSDIQINRYTST